MRFAMFAMLCNTRWPSVRGGGNLAVEKRPNCCGTTQKELLNLSIGLIARSERVFKNSKKLVTGPSCYITGGHPRAFYFVGAVEEKCGKQRSPWRWEAIEHEITFPTHQTASQKTKGRPRERDRQK